MNKKIDKERDTHTKERETERDIKIVRERERNE